MDNATVPASSDSAPAPVLAVGLLVLVAMGIGLEAADAVELVGSQRAETYRMAALAAEMELA